MEVVILMDKKQDLRIIKTKNALYEALIYLMKEQSFEEIKVSDICERALVNRSTFYAHYSDKYELFMDLMSTLKSEIIKSLEKNESDLNTKKYFIDMLSLLLDHIEGKRDVYYSMFLNNRNSIISDIIVDAINKDISARIQKFGYVREKGVPSEIVSIFYIGAVASAVLSWLRNGYKYSKQEMIDYLSILIPDDLGRI